MRCGISSDISDGTYHYVMWYTYQPESNKQIDSDITKCLQEHLDHDLFEYIWYKNPKMSISQSYHLQVFWHELPKVQII